MKLLIFVLCLVALVASQSYGNERTAFDELRVQHNVQSPIKSTFNEPLSPRPVAERYSSKPTFYSGGYKESSRYREGSDYGGPSKYTSKSYSGPSHESDAYKESAPYTSGPSYNKYNSPYTSNPAPYKSETPYAGSARLSAGRPSYHYESTPLYHKSGPAHYESSGPSTYESGSSNYESSFSGPSYYSRVKSAPSGQIKKIKNPKNYLSAPTHERIVQVEDVPRIGQNGVPLDTPDVVRAKAAHLEAHAKVLQRYRRGAYHHGGHGGGHGHGHGHAYSTQNHNAHFGHHHAIHVHGGHEHHRRKRGAHYHGGHGHAYSTQNHNAHFGHPHVVHVHGGHGGGYGGHHEHSDHHIYKRDTYSSAGSTQNSNVYHGESKPIRVAGSGYPHAGAQVPHETAEVQLAKQAHFLARDKALKQTGQYQKPAAPPAYRGYESRNDYSRYQTQPEQPYRPSGSVSGNRESYESREYY